jgi:hypothetical protein
MPLKSRRTAAWAGVLLLALGVRVALLVASGELMTSRHAELERRDVALMHDGRLYLLVARSVPFVYQPPAGAERESVDYPRLTVYMPALPALIRAVDVVVRDPRTSALLGPLLAGGAAVAAFVLLARRHVAHPFVAAALFAVVPPTWVLVSAMPFSECVLILSAVLAFLFFQDGRHVWAAVFGGLAAVSQKSGFLVTVALVWAIARRDGIGGWRTIAVYGISALLPLALQLYLYTVFGDPLVNVKATREVYGASPFTIFPGAMLIAGFFQMGAMTGGSVWPIRIFVLLSLAIYVGALWVSRRDPRPETRPLRIWVGVVLLFNLMLGGNWSYLNFPRLMVLAGPPAVLLWMRRYETRWNRAVVATLLVAGIACSLWYGLESVGVSLRVFEQREAVDDLVRLRRDFF